MIKLNITGDLFVKQEISDNPNYYSIDPELVEILNEGDLNILNLEAPITDEMKPIQKIGPALKMGKSVIGFLKELKFDMVTLANNHILDYGQQGLFDTIRTLNESNIAHLGAGKDLKEASAPLVKEINGLKVGFLNFAENEFSNSYNNGPGANPLDIIDNTLAIQKLKNETDKLIVILHGGNEMHHLPSPRVKKLLRYFADQGADAVIAHHTHVYNGFEIYNGCPIVYGLGNFVFSMDDPHEGFHVGAFARLTIESGKDIGLEILPFRFETKDKIEVLMLKGEELKNFIELDKSKTEIINDDNLLEKEFESHVQLNKIKYFHFLQPYTSKYFHKLYSMGIIPNFLKNSRKRIMYLNLIRCEPHRDVLFKLMKEDVE